MKLFERERILQFPESVAYDDHTVHFDVMRCSAVTISGNHDTFPIRLVS